MRTKHIAFQDVDKAPWTASQREWLERSIASGGLVDAWGSVAESGPSRAARAVFTWRDQEALDRYMEETHDLAMARMGSAAKSAALYLEDLQVLGPRADATYVGEAIAWLKDGGVEPWLASQPAWTSALSEADGFVGGSIRRGRRTFIVTSFWRDRAAHHRFLRDVVPRLREDTRGDEQTARLVRFEGALEPSLSFSR